MYFFILQEKTQAQGFAVTKFEELRRWVKTVLSLILPADEQGSLCLPSWLFCKPGCRLRVMGSLTDGSQGCQMHMCVNISAPLWGPNFLLGVQGTRLWSLKLTPACGGGQIKGTSTPLAILQLLVCLACAFAGARTSVAELKGSRFHLQS